MTDQTVNERMARLLGYVERNGIWVLPLPDDEEYSELIRGAGECPDFSSWERYKEMVDWLYNWVMDGTSERTAKLYEIETLAAETADCDLHRLWMFLTPTILRDAIDSVCGVEG